jgi:hypothetical protein
MVEVEGWVRKIVNFFAIAAIAPIDDEWPCTYCGK